MNNELIARQIIDRGLNEEGLRSYMLKVYKYMASGLALTGMVAYSVSRSEMALRIIFETNLFWVVLFAPLGIAIFLSAGIENMKAAAAQGIFWLYSGLMGLSLASIFIVYTGASIARVFFVTASMFAAMSFYGYCTKRDLTGFGSFLFMGLVGLIIAMSVNLFLQGTAIHFMTSTVGVLLFVGFTAYDTQVIKNLYLESEEEEDQSKKAICGALRLYLDFVNLSLHLLALCGDS